MPNGTTLIGERAQDRERVVTTDANGGTEIRYRRVYIVETDEPRSGALRVALTDGIPLLNHIYEVRDSQNKVIEYDPLVRVVERRAQQIPGSHTAWAVEIVYSNKHADPARNQGDAPDAEGDEDIEDESPAVHFGFETKVVPVESTRNPISQNPLKGWVGAGAVNSAGEKFDPPPEYETSRPILTITINQIALDFATVRAYQDATNSDNFLGAPPNTVRCRIEADRVYRNGFKSWRVTYNFVFEKEDWNLKVLDIGTYYIDASDENKIKAFVTEDDPPQPRIGLLDADGDELHPADLPHFVILQVYDQLPFALLNLPIGNL